MIKAQVIEFGNEATWSTRRVERAPGTPFSWATCDETKVAALPRSRGQGDGRKLETSQKEVSEISDARTILVLLLATALLPAIF